MPDRRGARPAFAEGCASFPARLHGSAQPFLSLGTRLVPRRLAGRRPLGLTRRQVNIGRDRLGMAGAVLPTNTIALPKCERSVIRADRILSAWLRDTPFAGRGRVGAGFLAGSADPHHEEDRPVAVRGRRVGSLRPRSAEVRAFRRSARFGRRRPTTSRPAASRVLLWMRSPPDKRRPKGPRRRQSAMRAERATTETRRRTRPSRQSRP